MLAGPSRPTAGPEQSDLPAQADRKASPTTSSTLATKFSSRETLKVLTKTRLEPVRVPDALDT
jgi:hypothetical protein